MDAAKEICVFLDNYWYRSEVFRVLQFSSALLGGVAEVCGSSSGSEKLLTVSYCLSGTRVTLRLLDDLPALLNTLKSFQRGRLVGVVEALLVQIYYPVEHLAWAAQQGIISLNSSRLWTLAIILWILPLLMNVIKLLAMMARDKTTPTSHQRRTLITLKLVRCLCDLSLAVYWLPKGWLWGGALPASVWGLLGTVSSLIKIYETVSVKNSTMHTQSHS